MTSKLTILLFSWLSVCANAAPDPTLDNLRDLHARLEKAELSTRANLIAEIQRRPELIEKWAKQVQLLNNTIENRLLKMDQSVRTIGVTPLVDQTITHLRPLISTVTELQRLACSVANTASSRRNPRYDRNIERIKRAGAYMAGGTIYLQRTQTPKGERTVVKRLSTSDSRPDPNPVPRGPRRDIGKALHDDTVKHLLKAGVIEPWSRTTSSQSFAFKTESQWIKIPARIDGRLDVNFANPLESTGLTPFDLGATR